MSEFFAAVRRQLASPFALGLLLLCALGVLGEAHFQRQSAARELADALLSAYIDGDAGFQEMRDFYERRRGTDLRGVGLRDTAGVQKNTYPRDFEPSGWRVRAPIKGADGVVRDEVELAYHFWPPPGPGLALGVTVFIAGFAVRLSWGQYEARRAADAAARESEAARRESEARLALREREDELRRLSEVWSTFHAQMTDDSSQLTNHIQSLNGFIAQIDISLKDAVHDLYKAPLLGTGDLVEKGQVSLADVKSFLRCLEDRSIEVTREEMAAFVRNVDETMDAIKWVVDGLPEYADKNTTPVDPSAELAAFITRLPPVLRKPDDGLIIEADTSTPQPLVMFNPVHFRSVVKNSLYNAVAAIRRARRTDPDREARVTIRFQDSPDRLGLLIEDTGDGLSEAALQQLYRGRVAREGSRRRGGKGSMIVAAYLGFHGAEVELCNRPEGGARVIFWFTKAPVAAALPDTVDLTRA